MVIVSLISMYILYAISALLFEIRIGLMAVLFFAVSGGINYFSRGAMPQMVMVLFCLLAFYSSLRIKESKWAIVFGLSASFAVFTHPATGLILISISAFVIQSLYSRPVSNRKQIVTRCLVGLIPSVIVLYIIADLPLLLFRDQINGPHYYLEHIVKRGGTISHGYFLSLDHIIYLFKNIWESEFICSIFILVGVIVLLAKYRKLNQFMVIIIPTIFILIYFFMSISYRFRMFILIYPFLHIIAGLGFVYVYDYSLKKFKNKNIKMLFVKCAFVLIVLIIISNGVILSVTSENLNRRSFQALCAGLDRYIANLPEGEIRDVSYAQGHLKAWLSYYFARGKIEKLYPYLSKSVRWDRTKVSLVKENYGDILIIEEGCEFSDRITKDKTKALIGKRKPIIRVPYSAIDRSGYLESTFNRKMSFLALYDLKAKQ